MANSPAELKTIGYRSSTQLPGSQGHKECTPNAPSDPSRDFGIETIEFARRGARATGLDFSDEAIRNARQLANRDGVDIDYVHANVYDAANAVGGKQYDFAYTGKGAICYLPDLPTWASVATRLLRSGRRLSIVEFHPILQSLSPKPRTRRRTRTSVAARLSRGSRRDQT